MQDSNIPVYFVSSYGSVCCSWQFSLSLGSTMYFVLVIKKMLRYTMFLHEIGEVKQSFLDNIEYF